MYLIIYLAFYIDLITAGQALQKIDQRNLKPHENLYQTTIYTSILISIDLQHKLSITYTSNEYTQLRVWHLPRPN